MSLYDIPVRTLTGEPASLGEYRGKVLLIVNVASKCGFTPQYAGLQRLHDSYSDQGFAVLGFPCDQFGHQEPGDEEQISSFCQRNYGVAFPMFAKVDVNGDAAHPLFRHLKKEAKGLLGTEAVKWNFTKFLVDRDGRVKQRFAPKDTPEELDTAIAAAML